MSEMSNMIQFDENENHPSPSFDNHVPNDNFLLDTNNSEMKNSIPSSSPPTKKIVLNEVNYNTSPVSDGKSYESVESSNSETSQFNLSAGSEYLSKLEPDNLQNTSTHNLFGNIKSIVATKDNSANISSSLLEEDENKINLVSFNNSRNDSQNPTTIASLPEAGNLAFSEVKSESQAILNCNSSLEFCNKNIPILPVDISQSPITGSSLKETRSHSSFSDIEDEAQTCLKTISLATSENIVPNFPSDSQNLMTEWSSAASLSFSESDKEVRSSLNNHSFVNSQNGSTGSYQSPASGNSVRNAESFSNPSNEAQTSLNSNLFFDGKSMNVPTLPSNANVSQGVINSAFAERILKALDQDITVEPSARNENDNIPLSLPIVCQDISNGCISLECSSKTIDHVPTVTPMENGEIIAELPPNVENASQGSFSEESVVESYPKAIGHDIRVVPSMRGILHSQMAEFEENMCGENLSAFNDDPIGIKISFAEGTSTEASAFDNFSELGNLESGAKVFDDFPFKVPAVPVTNEFDEEFTDAVQFFQDPSSFQFLENIKTDSSSEEPIPRSSLYINFDPLHSKQPNTQDNCKLFTQAMASSNHCSDVTDATSDSEVRSNNDSTPPSNGEGVVNKHIAMRESLGSILISFDSPVKAPRALNLENDKSPDPVSPQLYTEEEMQQRLKILELTIQEEYLKKQREMDQESMRKKESKNVEMEKLHHVCYTQKLIIEELLEFTVKLSEKGKNTEGKLEMADTEIRKLKDDLKTANEDLQSVETTFADFHKRYEQCKGMLKVYKDNEDHWKAEIKEWELKLKEQEQMYTMLQERTEEMLGKANSEVAGIKKASEAQNAVLKAQLKKAELKISSLESDIKQVKIENSQLGGLCDDLMAKVTES